MSYPDREDPRELLPPDAAARLRRVTDYWASRDAVTDCARHAQRVGSGTGPRHGGLVEEVRFLLDVIDRYAYELARREPRPREARRRP